MKMELAFYKGESFQFPPTTAQAYVRKQLPHAWKLAEE